MPKPKGYVDRRLWLSTADNAGQELETNGYLLFATRWQRKVLKNRGNHAPWQEKKLDEIGFPLTYAENNRWKKAKKRAKVDRNMAIMAD